MKSTGAPTIVSARRLGLAPCCSGFGFPLEPLASAWIDRASARDPEDVSDATWEIHHWMAAGLEAAAGPHVVLNGTLDADELVWTARRIIGT